MREEEEKEEEEERVCVCVCVYKGSMLALETFDPGLMLDTSYGSLSTTSSNP